MPAIVGWGVQTLSQILSRRVTFVAGTPALPSAVAREVVSVPVPGESVPLGLPVTRFLEKGFTVPLCVQPGSAQRCGQRLLQCWLRPGGLHARGGGETRETYPAPAPESPQLRFLGRYGWMFFSGVKPSSSWIKLLWCR